MFICQAFWCKWCTYQRLPFLSTSALDMLQFCAVFPRELSLSHICSCDETWKLYIFGWITHSVSPVPLLLIVVVVAKWKIVWCSQTLMRSQQTQVAYYATIVYKILCVGIIFCGSWKYYFADDFVFIIYWNFMYTVFQQSVFDLEVVFTLWCTFQMRLIMQFCFNALVIYL